MSEFPEYPAATKHALTPPPWILGSAPHFQQNLCGLELPALAGGLQGSARPRADLVMLVYRFWARKQAIASRLPE